MSVNQAVTPIANRLIIVLLRELLHYKAIGSKVSNHHVYAVSRSYQPALIRKSHPVRSASFGGAALPQLTHLFQAGNHQLPPSLLVDQKGIHLLIVQWL